MKTKIEEIIAAAAKSPENAKECSKQVLAVIRDVAERHGLDRKAQTYALIRKPDNSYVFHPHDSVVTDAVVDMSDLPNARYHDRIFPKDYTKKKKAKRRQEKRARRRNK